MASIQNTNQSFLSRTIKIGNVSMGGLNPIRVQSMTSTNTLNTHKTVEQSIRMIEAGCELVRITTPTIKEAKNLATIKQRLKEAGYEVPIIADIHFNAKVAEHAAKLVEKIRINPGNYTGAPSKLKTNLSEHEYQLELEKTAGNLEPLLKVCKEYGTVIRVGVNHGSLAERVIHKYGNTPTGMVASAMEFIKICEAFQFQNLVLSMKSSNLKIMVQAYRLLAKKMMDAGMDYPLHLGVTEAGNGLYGRIKSTAGISTLLQEGIGDTIRVSLTEAPENELVFAKKLVQLYDRATEKQNSGLSVFNTINPFEYHRRNTILIDQIVGGAKPPIVISSLKNEEADFIFDKTQNLLLGKEKKFKIVQVEEETNQAKNFVELKLPLSKQKIKLLNQELVLLISAKKDQPVSEIKKGISFLIEQNIKNPVVVKRTYRYNDFDELLIKASAEFGSLLIDGLIDGVWIENEKFNNKISPLSFRILQACGSRITSTEFIACPSCGRTKFNIEKAFEEVKKETYHLKGLKIAVMGCVVNGPGEMADADYGYIGAGNGKVNLYKSRELIKQGVDEKNAVFELVALIKKYGDWKDKN